MRMIKIQNNGSINPDHQMLTRILTWEELSFMAGANEKWYNPFRRWFGRFLENKTYFYHMIQQSHFLLGVYPNELKI